MAQYRKVATRIWTDPAFRLLSAADKIATLEAITAGEPPLAFMAHVGPRFRERTTPSRRPDLSGAAWRQLRRQVLLECGTTCRYCAVDCSDDPTVDHIVPVSRGGEPLDARNLTVACRRCNSAKGGREGWA